MTGCDRSYGLPALSRVWQLVKLSDVNLGTRPRYSAVVDENVKKPNKQSAHCHCALFLGLATFLNEKKITLVFVVNNVSFSVLRILLPSNAKTLKKVHPHEQ